MGLFNFSKYSNLEKSIFDLYTQMINNTGISFTEARKITKDMLDRAIKESKEEGTYCFPQNLGDLILDDAENNNPTIKKIVESIKKKIPRKREDGVEDEDIKWWWNLNDIERRMMLMQDDTARMSLYISLIEKSKETSQEKAIKKALDEVAKYHPIFGDPDDTRHSSGDDKPLPYELKDRINIYIQKRANENSEKYKKEIEKSSSFNALVRKEIKAGNI